jgi:tetratricopeptide (TPR) repeat protein
MKQAATPHRLSRVLAALLFLFPAGLSPLPAGPSDSSLERLKSKAASQHEIVMLLIKKKDYNQAVKEACKIFDMNWPDGQEALLLKELIGLSDEFSRHGQAAISLQLVEKNDKSFRQTSSQIAILKEKGFLYKSLKKDDKSLECFSKAQELENRK